MRGLRGDGLRGWRKRRGALIVNLRSDYTPATLRLRSGGVQCASAPVPFRRGSVRFRSGSVPAGFRALPLRFRSGGVQAAYVPGARSLELFFLGRSGRPPLRRPPPRLHYTYATAPTTPPTLHLRYSAHHPAYTTPTLQRTPPRPTLRLRSAYVPSPLRPEARPFTFASPLSHRPANPASPVSPSPTPKSRRPRIPGSRPPARGPDSAARTERRKAASAAAADAAHHTAAPHTHT